MILKDLLANTPVYETIGPRQIRITGISLNPSEAKEGHLYIYSPEKCSVSYEEAIDLAIQNGVSAICIGKEEKVYPRQVTYVRTYNYARFLSAASRNFYHNPSQNMRLVGITGSHGKTTVGWMVKSILNVAGIPGIMIGTSCCQVGDQSYISYEGEMNPLNMNALLHKAVEEKVHWGIIECTYTGIMDERFRHVWFDSVIYTDLYTYFKNKKADYHYFEMRKTLLDHLKVTNSPIIVNVDDFYTSELKRSKTVGYGLYTPCEVTARDIELFPMTSRFTLLTPKGSKAIELHVPGIHNVYNALAATAWGLAEKLDLDSIIKGIEDFTGIPNIDIEPQPAGTITVQAIRAFKASELAEKFKSFKNISRNEIITILCLDNFDDTEALNSIIGVISQYSGFCTITLDYLSPHKMEETTPKMMPEMQDTIIRYEIDHYKALRKAAEQLKGGGHILIVTGEGYNGSEKE